MESIKLQCPVTIKVKVTEKFRKRAIDDMEKRLSEIDLYVSQTELQKKKLIEEHADSNMQQVANIAAQMDADRGRALEEKASLEQQIADLKKLGEGAELVQGTLQHVMEVKVGDDMSAVMNSEIIIEDGKVIEIRN